MKKIEINRIYKCFIEKDYENILKFFFSSSLCLIISLKETFLFGKRHDFWFDEGLYIKDLFSFILFI